MNIKKMLVVALSVMVFYSCSSDGNEKPGFGTIRISAVADDDAIVVSKGSLGLTNLPMTGDFSLAVTSTNGFSQNWSKISAYDASTKYSTGLYRATVSYGDISIEGFDSPYFTGYKDFYIDNGSTTDVTVQASIGNAAVAIVCTENFENYFPQREFTLVTAAHNTTIRFEQDEMRCAFIDPYKFTVSGSVVTQTGEVRAVAATEFTDIEARTLYKIKYDVNSGQVGGAKLVISFNDQVIDTQDIEIELNDRAGRTGTNNEN